MAAVRASVVEHVGAYLKVKLSRPPPHRRRRLRADATLQAPPLLGRSLDEAAAAWMANRTALEAERAQVHQQEDGQQDPRNDDALIELVGGIVDASAGVDGSQRRRTEPCTRAM